MAMSFVYPEKEISNNPKKRGEGGICSFVESDSLKYP
jgi:hypothetical protein